MRIHATSGIFTLAPTPQPRTSMAPVVIAPVPATAPSASMPPAAPAPAAPVAVALPPIPNFLQLGPADAPLPNKATILSTLAKGRHFPPEVDQRMRDILGVQVTATGFEDLFAPLLPSARWVVSDPELDRDRAVNFIISAVGRDGRVVFEVGVALCRWPDGAIEAHTFSADVDPQYRGLGITARGELLQAQILRALSSHPNSRLTLAAGTWNDANTGRPQAGNGGLVHASRGYMFADTFGMHTRYWEYNPDALSDAAGLDPDPVLMTKHYLHWIAHEPTLFDHGRPADLQARLRLSGLAQDCRQPWDYLAIKGDTAGAMCPTPEGGLKPTPLGVAFMLSGDTPEWFGLRFVNPPDIDCPPAEAQLRHAAALKLDTQLAKEIAHSQVRSKAFTGQVWQQANSAEPRQRAQAYVAMGMAGAPSVAPVLRELLYGRASRILPAVRHTALETAPQARAALMQALELLSGRPQLKGLQDAAVDESRTQDVRNAMTHRLRAIIYRNE